MDYFWLLAPVWAAFGALLMGVVLRRLDISRVSYREARQTLSVIVASLSRRIEQNEQLGSELSEQLQILRAKQASLVAEDQTADGQRLLEYMQDWIANVKRFIDHLDGLQKRLKSLEQEYRELRLRVNRLAETRENTLLRETETPGVVTEETLGRLSETEKGVLQILVDGPKSAPEIGRLLTKSREHTARLMKLLFEHGFVDREAARQPYAYRLNQKVKAVIERSVG